MRLSRHLLCCSVALLAACASNIDTPSGFTNPPQEVPAVTTVTVTPALASVEVGGTTTLAADVRDQAGKAMTGKAVVWSSSNVAVAAVDATSGVVTAIAAGTATISATVDGKIGTATITVTPSAVASVTLTAPSGSLQAGESVSLAVSLKDRNGTVLTGRKVTWSSSATAVANVDSTGKVTAVAAGSATITALSEGISGTATVFVASPAGTAQPSITSIAPTTLVPGGSATITGANFAAGAANNAVTVAGVAATVTSATATQIAFTLPASGFPCQSTKPVAVAVTNANGTATTNTPLTTATTRALAVGASILLTSGASLACNELPAGGTYLVSVFNAGTSLDQTAGVELKGVSGGALASRLAPGVAARSTILAAPSRPARSVVEPRVGAAARAHLAHLEQDAQLVRRLGSPRRYRAAPRTSGASRSLSPSGATLAAVPTTVGATATMTYHFNGCRASDGSQITARVVYVGPKTIVLEDNAGPLAGKIDGDMIALAQEFEQKSFPLLANFGDPLKLDSETDANGRIIMLFTPRVNAEKINGQDANTLGFVASCDFYPPTADPLVGASNQAEIFYARAVTDTSASSTTLNGRSQWRRLMPSTLIHETKHITAFAERLSNPATTAFEETWLEEATAQLASEMYGRAIHGNGWRTNSSYAGVLDCEVRPTVPSCNGGTFVMGNHFGFLSDFLQNFESKTIISGTDDNDIYGSSWIFARWLVDTYAGNDEGAFIRSLVKTTLRGTANVTSASGKSWPELLSNFTLMLAADDLPNVPAPFTEQSWNLPGVFAGYHADFSTRPAAPLALRQSSFGVFTANVASLKGGGAMLLRLNGNSAAAPQVLDLHAANGGSLGSSPQVGMSVLRIQ